MNGPFFLKTVYGKPALVDEQGRLLSLEDAGKIVKAGVQCYWGMSSGQIEQQHRDVLSKKVWDRGGWL